MKLFLYSLATASLAFALAAQPASAAAHRIRVDSPAETQRKAAAREKVATARKASALKRSSRHKFSMAEKMSHTMRVVLGLEESKAVTSPAKLTRQLHAHQRQLRVRARMASRAHRRRAH